VLLKDDDMMGGAAYLKAKARIAVVVLECVSVLQ